MAKVYTAKEMREAAIVADTVEVSDQFYGQEMDKIAAMLRQAADAMDREKKYEYAVEYIDLYHGGWSVYKDGLTLDEAQKLSHENFSRIVRREVGEWEEVKDGE